MKARDMVDRAGKGIEDEVEVARKDQNFRLRYRAKSKLGGRSD